VYEEKQEQTKKTQTSNKEEYISARREMKERRTEE
jgi:hypothetical protein